MKQIVCYNKILKDALPAEKVVSTSTLFWLRGMVANSKGHIYENEFYVFSYAL